MSVEIPKTFYFDVGGKIRELLTSEIELSLIDIQSELNQTACGPLVTACADLVVGKELKDEKDFRNDAFCAGGFMACASFLESNAPKPMRDRTMSVFSIRAVPLDLLSRDPAKSLFALEELALTGSRSHPELEKNTELVKQYYAEICSEEAGWLAFCGSGFVVYQFDNAWNNAVSLMLNEKTE